DTITLDCNGILLDDRYGSDTAISFVDETFWTIRNCTFNGYNTGIYFDPTSYNNTIENSTFLSSAARGIYINQGDHNNITNNTFFNNSAEGILIGSGSKNTLIWENRFLGNNNDGISNSDGTTNLCVNGLYGNYYNGAVDSGGWIVNDCGPIPNATVVVDGNGTFNLTWGSNLTVLTIAEGIINTYNDSSAALLEIMPASGPYEETVTSYRNGITINCSNTTLQNSGSGTAITINGERDITIQNCTFDNYDTGISLISADYNYIFNNTFLNNDLEGIDFTSGSCDNNVIKHNNFTTNDDDGIDATPGSASAGNNITENTFDSNVDYAIVIDSLMNNINVWRNNFRNNRIGTANYEQVYNDETTAAFNISDTGNYWTDFDSAAEDCNDINGDGFCDIDQNNMTGSGAVNDSWAYTNLIKFFNIAPSLTLSLKPTTAYTNDTLNVTANYTDLESDIGTVYFDWFINGTWNTSTSFANIAANANVSDNMTSGNFSRWTNITVQATPFDGTTNGTAVNVSINISNLVPEANGLVVNTTDTTTNDTNQNVTAYVTTSDADSDQVKIIYNWLINGTSFAVLNMPFEANVNSNATDYTGYHNATNVGMYFNETGGYDGKGAYEFNASSQRWLEVGKDSNFSNICIDGCTFSAWVKPKPRANSDVIIGRWDDTDNNMFFAFQRISNNRVYLSIHENGNSTNCAAIGVQSMTLGNWHYVTGTYNKTHTAVYLDGEFEAASACSFSEINQTAWEDSESTYIGATDDTPASRSAPFNGTIDEVMIFNKSLSSEQIKALYENKTNITVSAETNAGDNWSVEVTPNDGIEDGLTSLSNNVTILNTAPSIAVSLKPITAYTNDTLNVTANYTDNDGDIGTVYFDWFINGTWNTSTSFANIAANANISDNMTSGNFSRWTNITVQATPFDGTTNGTAVNVSINITNYVPEIEVSLKPITAYTNDTLNVTANYTDNDGETGTVYFDWFNNDTWFRATSFGSISSYTNVSDNLTSGNFSRWTNITVQATPFDGTTNGTAVNVSINITNYVPQAINYVISPSSPTILDTLNATFVVEDIDADVMTAYIDWFVNDTINETNITTNVADGTNVTAYLGTGNYSSPDNVTFQIVIYDGISNSTAVNSSYVVFSNIAPSLSSSLKPTTAYTNNTLNVTIRYTDINSDVGTIYFDWFKNNTWFRATSFSSINTGTNISDNLTSGNFSRWTNITVQATPFDGIENGTAVNVSINITNIVPEQRDLALSPDTIYTNSTNLNATVVLWDEDQNEGDTLTAYFDWFINSTWQYANYTSGLSNNTNISAYLKPSNFTKWSNVTVQIVTFDGFENGTAVNSSWLNVTNSIPYINDTDIYSPNNCSTEEINGSAIHHDQNWETGTFYFDWFVEDTANNIERINYSEIVSNVNVGANTSRNLSIGNFTIGNNVTLQITPYDLFENGSSVNTTSITILDCTPAETPNPGGGAGSEETPAEEAPVEEEIEEEEIIPVECESSTSCSDGACIAGKIITKCTKTNSDCTTTSYESTKSCCNLDSECSYGYKCLNKECEKYLWCTDSDGDNKFTKGIVKSNLVGYENGKEDKCTSTNKLIEYACKNGNFYPEEKKVDCSFKCDKGACIQCEPKVECEEWSKCGKKTITDENNNEITKYLQERVCKDSNKCLEDSIDTQECCPSGLVGQAFGTCKLSCEPAETCEWSTCKDGIRFETCTTTDELCLTSKEVTYEEKCRDVIEEEIPENLENSMEDIDEDDIVEPSEKHISEIVETVRNMIPQNWKDVSVDTEKVLQKVTRPTRHTPKLMKNAAVEEKANKVMRELDNDVSTGNVQFIDGTQTLTTVKTTNRETGENIEVTAITTSFRGDPITDEKGNDVTEIVKETRRDVNIKEFRTEEIKEKISELDRVLERIKSKEKRVEEEKGVKEEKEAGKNMAEEIVEVVKEEEKAVEKEKIEEKDVQKEEEKAVVEEEKIKEEKDVQKEEEKAVVEEEKEEKGLWDKIKDALKPSQEEEKVVVGEEKIKEEKDVQKEEEKAVEKEKIEEKDVQKEKSLYEKLIEEAMPVQIKPSVEKEIADEKAKEKDNELIKDIEDLLKGKDINKEVEIDKGIGEKITDKKEETFNEEEEVQDKDLQEKVSEGSETKKNIIVKGEKQKDTEEISTIFEESNIPVIKLPAARSEEEGQITEVDVRTANSMIKQQKATPIILGYKSRPTKKATEIAEELKIDIITGDSQYELLLRYKEFLERVELAKNAENRDKKDVKTRIIIPKHVAESASELVFVSKGVEILQDDPIIEWSVDELDAGETKEFSYIVKRKLTKIETVSVVSGEYVNKVEKNTLPCTDVTYSETKKSVAAIKEDRPEFAGNVEKLGYDVVVPPFNIKCDKENMDFTINIPENYANVKVLKCDGDNCEPVKKESVKELQCGNEIVRETVIEEEFTKFMAIDTKKVSINVDEFKDAINNMKDTMTFYDEASGDISISTIDEEANQPKNPNLKIIGAPVRLKIQEKSIKDDKVKITLPLIEPIGFENNSVGMYIWLSKDEYEEDNWKYIESEINSGIENGNNINNGYNDKKKTISAEIDEISDYLDENNEIKVATMGITCLNCLNASFEKVYEPKIPTKDVVILVHGLASSPATYEQILKDIKLTDQPFQAWTFGYPTTDEIEKNAKEFARLIEEHQEEFDNIYIAAHSLGGLVTQQALYLSYIENIKQYGSTESKSFKFLDKVKRIVTVGTPNEGSPGIEPYKELFQQLINLKTNNKLFNVNSDIVTRLSKGLITPRVPGIDYYVIAGSKPFPFSKVFFERKIKEDIIVEPNDGIVGVKSAQHIGNDYVDDKCINYWELGLTHTDLLNNPIGRKQIEKIVSEEILDKAGINAVMGHNQFFQFHISGCSEKDMYMVVGEKLNESEVADPAGCKCGDNYCAAFESYESCPIDCPKEEKGFEFGKGGAIAILLLLALVILALIGSAGYMPYKAYKYYKGMKVKAIHFEKAEEMHLEQFVHDAFRKMHIDELKDALSKKGWHKEVILKYTKEAEKKNMQVLSKDASELLGKGMQPLKIREHMISKGWHQKHVDKVLNIKPKQLFEEIKEYAKQRLGKGHDRLKIREDLIKKGWHKEHIDKILEVKPEHLIKEIKEYARDRLKKGHDKLKIREDLIKKGWQEEHIDKIIGTKAQNIAEELKDYTKQRLDKGHSRLKIREDLVKKGWNHEYIDKILGDKVQNIVKDIKKYAKLMLKKGHSRLDIREDLIKKGWQEEHIDKILGIKPKDMINKMVDYARQRLKNGNSRLEIRKDLINKGWKEEYIDKVLGNKIKNRWEELKRNINERLKHGENKLSIRERLVKKGWPNRIVDNILKLTKEEAIHELGIYIYRNLKKKENKINIRKELIKKGWPNKIIDRYLNLSKEEGIKLLKEYISKQLKEGKKASEIKQILIKKGWPKKVVNKLLNIV
ncbi:MAG: LamG-like jellyroll fold domain-containing protein, partial [Candidatus Woesearchaeota archaeon]